MNQEGYQSREKRNTLVQLVSEAARAGQNAVDLLDEAFTAFLGVNRTDGRCLDIIERHGTVTAGVLADEAGLTTGAVTAVGDRLATMGYVRRVPDETDRRRVLIELTPQAQQLTDEVFGPIAAAAGEVLDEMSDRDIVVVLRFLEAGERINREHAQAVRRRVTKTGLRQRLEQARALKKEAKALAQQVKADLKDPAVWLDTMKDPAVWLDTILDPEVRATWGTSSRDQSDRNDPE